MMRWSYTVGRLDGVALKIHITFLLLLAWAGYRDFLYGGPAAALWSIGFVLAVFACVTFHEFGHVFMAKVFGIRTRDVILLPIGGVARLESFPRVPRQEFLIALAGPAVTLAIAAGLYAGLLLGGGDITGGQLFTYGRGFARNLLAVNIFILLFNMIPAFPMDGGRVLRAVLAHRIGFRRATRIAAAVGRGFAVVFAILALTSGWGGGLLLLIALFVFLAAGSELAAVDLPPTAGAGHGGGGAAEVGGPSDREGGMDP